MLCDTLERLRGGANGDGRLTVRITLTSPAALLAPAVAAGPLGLDVRDVRAVDATMMARCAPSDVPALVAWLVGRGAGIREVRSEAESLESVYLRAVRGER